MWRCCFQPILRSHGPVPKGRARKQERSAPGESRTPHRGGVGAACPPPVIARRCGLRSVGTRPSGDRLRAAQSASRPMPKRAPPFLLALSLYCMGTALVLLCCAGTTRAMCCYCTNTLRVRHKCHSGTALVPYWYCAALDAGTVLVLYCHRARTTLVLCCHQYHSVAPMWCKHSARAMPLQEQRNPNATPPQCQRNASPGELRPTPSPGAPFGAKLRATHMSRLRSLLGDRPPIDFQQKPPVDSPALPRTRAALRLGGPSTATSAGDRGTGDRSQAQRRRPTNLSPPQPSR